MIWPRIAALTLVWASVACSAADREAVSQGSRDSISSPSQPSPPPRTYASDMRPIKQAPCGKERTSGVDVAVSSRYRCYQISGKTLLDLHAAMGRSGPRGEDSNTHWRVTWHYEYAGYGPCRINSLDVTVELRATMPRWTNPVGASLELVHDWNRFIRAVIRHEDGHARLAVEAAHRVIDRLSEFEAPCEGFIGPADSVANSIIDEMVKKQRSYDERTDDGATQGASLVA
jgi:predicted secreted Zn-dependent protease